MAYPYSNLRSKLNRAVVAYLISQPNCGTADDITPFNTRLVNSLIQPSTTVRARAGKPRVEMSGNYDVALQITVKGTGVQDVGDTSESARLLFDLRLASIYDAMFQSDDNYTLNATAKAITSAGRALAASDPVNNGDMDDFTVLAITDGGFGDPNINEQECAWEEQLMFNVLCCGSHLLGYSLTD